MPKNMPKNTQKHIPKGAKKKTGILKRHSWNFLKQLKNGLFFSVM
jgi:hypothetical protein